MKRILKRLYVIMVALVCAIGCCNAQLVHTKGKMGAGLRGGIGTHNCYNFGLFYHYYISDKIGVYLEVDHEKSFVEQHYVKEVHKEDDIDFTNQFMIGVGCEYVVYRPTKWLLMELSLAGNIGRDHWDSNINHWDEKHLVGGLNGGFGLEAYPWQRVSFMVKARQFVLFGKGMNYLKPDFSLGVKVNW